jgi:hypothetical protein
MKSIAACLPLMLAGAILLVVTILLGTSRLEYCGQPESLRPPRDTRTAVETRCPTLAPPQKVVFVRVEADKSDLQIGWADN